MELTTHIGLVADTGANGLAGRRRQTHKNSADPIAGAPVLPMRPGDSIEDC